MHKIAASEPLYLKVYLLRPGIIELRYFTGSQSQKIMFGVEYILRLHALENKKFQPIHLSRIFYN